MQLFLNTEYLKEVLRNERVQLKTLLDSEAKENGMTGEIHVNITSLAIVAIPLNNHSIAYTFTGNYTEDGKVTNYYAKLFLRQADPYPYQFTKYRIDLTCMVQKFKYDDNTLLFESYKDKLDKTFTEFFKKFINWQSGRAALGTTGYLGSTMWQALNKASGKISALFEGLIFEVTHDDLKLIKEKEEKPIKIMDVDESKAL